MRLDAQVLPSRGANDGVVTGTGNNLGTPGMTSSAIPACSGPAIPAKVAEVPRDVLKAFPHTKRVGNYLLGRTLGEGSFAKVKEGLHILTAEKVAIKVIDKKKAKEDAYVRRNMRREGKLLQQVRHRGVVQLFEVMETENSYYLVTELCEGGDLMDHICARRRLDEREVRRYIRQVVSAVDYLHRAGILHRDLKVENLLLDENKNIKIIDFGLSNSVRVSHTKEGSVAQEYCVTQCGSPAYAAPELLGNKKYGPKVDVWSIGVNMYAMLTGNLPFTVEPFNIKTLHTKMLNGDMNNIPEHLSKGCKELLRRLLTADPDQRISLAEAMHHPWITDGKNRALEPAAFPNKLSADDLDAGVVQHMAATLEYRLSDVVRLVTANIPSSATATYTLLHRKLRRHSAEQRVQGRVAAPHTQLLSVSHSTQDTSGYLSPGDVIDISPMTEREKVHPRRSAPSGNVGSKPITPRRQPSCSPERRLASKQVRNARVLERLYGEKERRDNLHSNSDGVKINTNVFKKAKRTDGQADDHVQLFKLAEDGRPTGVLRVPGQQGAPRTAGARPRPTPAQTIAPTPTHAIVTTQTQRESRRNLTPDPAGTPQEGVVGESVGQEVVAPPGDLPCIRETPATADCEAGSVTPHPAPHPAPHSPVLARRNAPAPKINNAFRLRAQTNARVPGERVAPPVSGRPAVPTSSQSTTSSTGRRSTCSGPGGAPAACPSPDQDGSVSDPATRREKRSARSSTGGGGMAGRVLVDAGHYDRYARRGPGAAGVGGPGDQYPATNRTFPAVSDTRYGPHTRKLVNLVYPTYHKPGAARAYITAAPRPTNPPSYAQQRQQRVVTMATRHETLNVTGEKTTLGAQDGRGVSRTHDLAAGGQPHPSARPVVTETRVVELGVEVRTPQSAAPTTRAPVTFAPPRDARVALPLISPPLLTARPGHV